MEITDIKVRKLFDEGPMKAIVSVTFDAQLAVHDIKVINARDKFFIVMPSRKNPDETYRDIVHPINAAFRAKLEAAVIDAFHEALEQAALEAENEEEESEDEEAEEEVKKLAEQYKMEVEKIKSILSMDQIKSNLVPRKVIDLLIAESKIS